MVKKRSATHMKDLNSNGYPREKLLPTSAHKASPVTRKDVLESSGYELSKTSLGVSRE